MTIRFIDVSGRVVNARLEPLHKQCVMQSGFCRDAIKRYVDSSLEMIAGAPVEPKEEQLRVLVRDSSFARQLIETHSRNNSPPPMMKRYLPDLWMVLAVAGDSVMWIASTALIERLGLDETAAFDLALKNTRAAMRILAHVARPLGQSPFSFSVGDNDSSRILMHSDWGVLAQAQKGKLVVAVPEADMIIFGTVRSDADLKRFKDTAAQAARGSANPLSGNIYRWRQDGWEAVTLEHVAHPHPAGGPGFGP